ncbi:MAG TPA: EAL domain-containing protein [Rubrivivax sp.]|nr:EAL domain-containing protein [Rubrivivax sp.]
MTLPCPAPLPAAAGDAALLRAWSALVDGLPDAAWIVDAASRRVVADNAAARRLLGPGGGSLVGLQAEALIATPEDLAFWDEAAAGTGTALQSETTLCGADGRSLHVTRSIRALHDGHDGGHGGGPGGAPRHYVVTACDRSVWRRAEDEREQLVAELQATLEATADGILVTDLQGGIRAFNRRFAQTWGMPEELLQRRQDEAVHEWMRRSVVDADTYQQRLRALQDDALQSASERLTLHSGQVLERVTRPLWCRGQAQGRVWSFRDLSGQLAAQQRIEQLSLTDALTGLPNRRRMVEQVAEQAAEQAAGAHRRTSHDGGCFALLVIDLDRFRRINDSLGHDSGDRVLVEVAQRVRGCMRGGDLLARTGGDQFALLVEGAGAQAAEAAARRVLDAVAAPYSVDGAQFTLTCSIGGALCPSHGHSADELLRHAEAAVLAVKEAGRGNYRVQRARRRGDRRGCIQLDHAMRQALASERFRLHFQPQVAMAGGRIVGAEALLRWRDPVLGEVSPARFIPVAEDSGFIVPLGDWVLAQAARQSAAWRARGITLPIAVNVSALQFRQPQFVERVAAVLAASGLPPQLLELELTESILLRDADEALQRLQALARLGVRLSIDDFGTGYSSLAYLKRFPIDKLKIDRSFIQGLPGEDSDRAIVVAILQMAAALGKKVIAEGVETESQRRFLLDAGCDEFQGFLYAPALDCRSFEQRWQQAQDQAQAALSVPPRVRLVSG